MPIKLVSHENVSGGSGGASQGLGKCHQLPPTPMMIAEALRVNNLAPTPAPGPEPPAAPAACEYG